MLLLIKKHTDTLLEQTKTHPPETLEFILNQQMQTFSFNPPLNLIEEGKWLLGVIFYERSNIVFNKTKKNNSFRVTIPCHWNLNSAQKTFEELTKPIDPRSDTMLI